VDQAEFFEQLVSSPLGWVAAGLWGAVWGSFFNVVIVRLPLGESVVHRASHCRSCGEAIAWYDNVPIVSYLVLRGRCRRCSAPISARYPLVELLVCALTLALYPLFVVGPAGAVGLRLARFVIASLFSGLLVAITFIDLYTLRIPDAITYPGIPICALLSLFFAPPHLWDGAVGAAGGYLLIRLIADGYRLVTGRVGMGYGDAKLLAMIGGLLGWQALLPALFLAALQGTLIGVGALLVLRRLRPPAGSAPPGGDPPEGESPGSPLRFARLPFGPVLGLAAIELLFLRDYLPLVFPYLW